MMKYSARSRHYLSLTLMLALWISCLPASRALAFSAGPDAAHAFARSTSAAARPGAQLSQPDAATEQRIRQAYGQLPSSFEPNRGQLDSRVKYVARGGGYAVFLTAAEAVFVLRGRQQLHAGGVSKAIGNPPKTYAELGQRLAERQKAKEAERKQAAAANAVIRMQLAGANENAEVTGVNELAARVNHFTTNNPQKWATDVPLYSKVQYKSVYPGIDLLYYSQGQQLEYDFVVSPGADPNAIALNFAGADSIEVNQEGSLLIHAKGKALTQERPKVYQEVNGTQQPIESRFVMKGQQVGFALGRYDQARPLIIDPVLSYSTFLGDEDDDDNGFDIAVDSSGDAYVVGQTFGLAFPTEDPFQSSHPGVFINAEAFLTKFNPAGSALIYSTYLGGIQDEAAYGVALDSERNVYITGYTDSADFPRQNAMQQSCGAVVSVPFAQCVEDEAFVTKIAPNGDHLIYSTYLGGSFPDRGRGIAVDAAHNVYVTGFTQSYDFPTTKPIQKFINGRKTLQESLESEPAADAFLTEIEPGGQFRVYSTFIGGALDDVGMGVAADAPGNAFITGFTDSTEVNPTIEPDPEVEPTPTPALYPTTPGAFQTQPSATGFTRDAFVTKVNAGGAAYGFSTLIGGEGSDEAYGVALGRDGSIYITGSSDSKSPAGYPTTDGAFQSENRGGYDAFITRFAPGGSSLLYSSLIGGQNNEGQGNEIDFGDDDFDGAAIAVDFAGNAYIAGWTDSTTVPVPGPDPGCASSFDFTDFSSTTNLTLNGDAAQSGNVLRLTPDATGQNGSAFYNVPVNGGANFTTTFGFKITVTDDNGAEGLAFNLTNDGPGTLPALGEFGTTSDFSVSLQTFDFGNADTLRIFYQGGLVAETDVTSLNLDDGNAHSATIAYSGGVVNVTFDGAGSAAATAPVDLSAISPSTFVGLSARTGDTESETPGTLFSEAHDILSWSFSGAATCQPPPPPELNNFPTKNAVQPNPGSAAGESTRDAFVAKFDTKAAGVASLIYSTYLGGIQDDEGQGIAVDVAANAYITGKTGVQSSCGCGSVTSKPNSINPSAVDDGDENNFPTTPGSFKTTKANELNDFPDQDAFVSKIGGGSFVARDSDSGFSIGGLVLRPNGSTPAPDVTVTITDSGNSVVGTTTTDASGFYGVDGLAPGTYTVTPSGGPRLYSFSPASRSVTITNQNERADFTATALHSIGGRVTEGSTGVGGVTITLTGDASATTTTDTNGNYQFDNLAEGGNYTVTPASPLFTFAPTSRSFNALTDNQANADFAATRLGFSLSGRVTEGSAGLSGVTITVTRTSDSSTVGTTTTANDGTYTLSGVPAGGNYIVTPSLAFYTFTPASRPVTNLTANQTGLDFAATRQSFAISGRIATSSNSPVSGVTVTLTGDASASTTTDLNGQYTFGNLQAGHNYTVTPTRPNFTFAPPSRTITGLSGNQTADFTATPGTVTFTAAAATGGPESTRGEGDLSFHVTVNRTGDASGEMVVEYATFNGVGAGGANDHSDYITSIGRLRFAPGETTKAITIFIVDDAFVEGNETFTLSLQNPSGGGVLGTTSTVTLTILDNDTTPPTRNPIDDPAFFVRQQYIDFLNREPDLGGFAGWVAILAGCPPGNANCDRVSVSSGFFRSPEFQERSFFAYRFYSTALGRIPRYREMMRDFSFVTGFLSDAELEAGRMEFIADFMSRQEFRDKYDALTDPAAYVNALVSTAGVTLPNKQQLIDDLAAGRMTRGQVLRAIAESREVAAKFYNEAFVVTEYFGYLRRDPDILYLVWIQTLNQNGGDYRAMVGGFMNSPEYRQRFGP